MAESDLHYNGTPSTPDDGTAGAGQEPATANNAATPAVGGNDYGLTTPLPDFQEGGPVYPGDLDAPADGATPVIPLPFPGEGGPVYPGNTGGSSGGFEPVIPLPFPGEGGPVYPGNNNNNNNSGGGTVTWFPTYPIFPNYPSSSQYYGQVRFLNATTGDETVNISIDNATYAVNSRFGTVTNYDWVSDGFHTVTVRRANGLRSILLQQTFPFSANQKVTMILTDSASGGLEMIRVIDRGCNNLPSGSGCFRFGNMSYSGSCFDLTLSGSTVFRNIRYQNVSSYKRAVAGTYQFTVTNASSYSVIRELPIIVIGPSGISAGVSSPVFQFSVEIKAGKDYTSYLIGNTWSNANLQVVTVED